MARFAVIEGENVVNVILIDAGEVNAVKAALAPAEVKTCPDGIGPGATYVDGKFIPAPPLLGPTDGRMPDEEVR